jgi:hypothetical protein
MSLQALLDDPLVPVRHGKILRIGGNAVPQRLHIVELLLDRQVVESGWRKRKRSRYDLVSVSASILLVACESPIGAKECSPGSKPGVRSPKKPPSTGRGGGEPCG